MNTETSRPVSGALCRLAEAELPVALAFRYRMLVECGGAPLLADDWRELTRSLYGEGYRADTVAHFGWRVEGRIVATAGAMVRDDFPACTFRARRYGRVMDVYVLPEHRRCGHARRLVAETLAWLRGKGVTFVRLGASEQAKQIRLYEKLGFAPSNEMRLNLE